MIKKYSLRIKPPSAASARYNINILRFERKKRCEYYNSRFESIRFLMQIDSHRFVL